MTEPLSHGFDFGSDTLGQFLERVASNEPAPGGGVAAAVAVGLAAGLVAMAARFSGRHFDDTDSMIAEADYLRLEALRLTERDAEAYGGVLAAYRLSKDTPDRPEQIKAALGRAAEVPLEIAKLGASVASLGSVVALKGNPNLHGDAFIAVILADAATKGAARLVELNTRLGGLDGRLLDDLTAYRTASADAVHLVSWS